MGECQFLNLGLNRLNHIRISMTQAGNRRASRAVEITLAGSINEIATFSGKG